MKANMPGKDEQGLSQENQKPQCQNNAMRDDVTGQGYAAWVSSMENISEIKRPGKTNGYNHEQDVSHGNKEPPPTGRASVRGAGLLHTGGTAQLKSGFTQLVLIAVT